MATDFEPVRVAVVGLGWFACDHIIPAIADAEYATVSAVVSGSASKAQCVADSADVAHALTYDRFRDGEGADEFDAVYVATPNARHLEFVTVAAELGKAVLCEKPLEVSVERAQELVDVCAEADVPLMSAYRLHADSGVRRLRELLAEGFLGDLKQAHGAFSVPLLDRGDADQWRLDADLAGGGPLVDLGVYHVNTLRFLLEADPVAVQATTSSTQPAFDEVEEDVSFRLTFPSGATADCTASYAGYPEDRLSLVGTEGIVRVENAYDVGKTRSVTAERNDVTISFAGSIQSEITEEFDYFAHCVRQGERPSADGIDGLTDVRVIDAIYESARTGQRVDL